MKYAIYFAVQSTKHGGSIRKDMNGYQLLMLGVDLIMLVMLLQEGLL